MVVLLGFTAYRLVKDDSGSDSPATSTGEQSGTKDSSTIRLIAVGDTFPTDALNKAAKQADGTYEYSGFMQNMKPFFAASDIRFCNQPVPAGGSEFGVSGYPTFNSPTEFSRDLNELGCNLINLGSNHSFDKGQEVINATIDYWKTLPDVLAIVGVNRNRNEQKVIPTFDIHGIRFAVLSYTTYTNAPPLNSYGLNVYDEDFAKSQLREARSKADFVIVSMRWGTEYSPNINTKQDQIAQFLADNGADAVIGHGAHVLQPVKVLDAPAGKKVPVWFGLGNFLNAQIPPETLFNGIAVMDIDKKTKAIELKYLPVYMHYEWTAEEKAREDLLARHSFALYTLDQAVEPLSRSQNNTSAEAQRERISNTLNKFTQITILRDSEY